MIDSPSDCPFVTSPLCSTFVTVQLIIIDLLHFSFIVLEVLVIVLTLCVLALLIVIRADRGSRSTQVTCRYTCGNTRR